MDCRILNVADVAIPFKEELINTIKTKIFKVKLLGFLANSDPAAEKYASWTEKSCEAIGMLFELRKVSRDQLEDKILEANEDPEIHGIMVYYPVFGGGHDQYLQNLVSPFKDVEGLCHTYRFNMYHNIRFTDSENLLKCIIPCTPLGIVKILDYCKVYDNDIPYGNQLHGKTITIINRSEVVGRPLAALLANDGAIVYSVDISDVLLFLRGKGSRKHTVSDTDLKMEQVLPVSDVIISGVPSKTYKVRTENLKKGVVVINFSSFPNFEEEVTSKASIYVSSVGKATVSMLQRNLLRLRKYQMRAEIKNP